ncbi:MAG: glycoside hydrolase domain-containing protein, partial [Sphingobacteriaceae bacterium]
KLDNNYHQGKEFVIKTYNNSDSNVYIQSIKLNGAALNKNYISFTDISKGGVLDIYMGPSPSDSLHN